MIGIQIGESLTCSGVTLYPLSADEATVLTSYKLIRDQGSGSLVVQFDDRECRKFDVHPNLGGASALNEILRGVRRLRD